MIHPAIARALDVARRRANGGPVSGPLHGETGGRTDVLPIDVQEDSFVVPADVVSALGEGNTNAGMALLEEYFGGPPEPVMASGGKPPKATPIIAAAGEYVVSPSAVAKTGNGDLNKGHAALNAFVKQVRRRNIQRLKSLPGPKK